MKKKKIISIIVCIVLVIGIVGFVFWNNRTVSTITLDINPSIEINLNKNDKVKSIKALNDDAKKVINDDLKGKSLDNTFEILINNLVEKGYTNKEDNLDVVLYVDGIITNKIVSEKIEFAFGKKEIHTEIITIDNVTKEDKKLAKEYNVSPAKIAYIKTITKENEKLAVEDLTNKPVSELIETKKTGNYCDTGHTLHGDKCYKEIDRVAAINGEVCPTGYYEKDEKCYEQREPIDGDNYICSGEFKLVDGKCIFKDIYDANGKCDAGTYDTGYCVVKEYIGQAKEYCRITPETDLLYNGRCLGRKPTINGGCINGDKLIGGYCYDTSSNSGYKADWICPDGSPMSNPDGTLINADKKCYKETKTKPTSYYCEGDSILNGTKCEFAKIEDAKKEKICPSGYKMVDENRCINYSKVVNKTNGYYCEMDNAMLNEKICIIYEIIEAKTN